MMWRPPKRDGVADYGLVVHAVGPGRRPLCPARDVRPREVEMCPDDTNNERPALSDLLLDFALRHPAALAEALTRTDEKPHSATVLPSAMVVEVFLGEVDDAT